MKTSSCSFLALAAAALTLASCSHSESDGRQYHGNASPLQGKMGVTFKRVPSTIEPVTADIGADPQGAATSTPSAPPPAAEAPEGLLGRFVNTDGPPGLLDRTSKPDEPGAEYWMHGQQSPNPVQSKMGVRVSRRKK